MKPTLTCTSGTDSSMKNFLDKTLTVRQIWRWTRRMLYVLIPIYIGAFFVHEWKLEMTTTPIAYKDQIPDYCKDFAMRSSDRPGGSWGTTNVDSFLLRGRVRRSEMKYLVNGTSKAPACLGYAVLTGIRNDKYAPDANFTEQWLDTQGDPVITVHVQYHKAYPTTQGPSK